MVLVCCGVALGSYSTVELSKLAARSSSPSELITLASRQIELQPPTWRKTVDVAFNLALAGASEPTLAALCSVAERELRASRWSRRGWSKPRSAHTLVQLAERAAAAGFRPPLGLYEIIADLLEEKGAYPETSKAIRGGAMDLCHPRAAIWIYRNSCRQRKPSASTVRESHANRESGSDAAARALSGLHEPERPLTVDIGCGYGIGLLGYARSPRARTHNALGCDLNPQAVRYANGIAKRWGVSGRTVFAQSDALEMLGELRRRERRVERIVLSCPTPFLRAAGKGAAGGNSQLPSSAESDDFLGGRQVIEEAVNTLSVGGTLLLASNVEDVALSMRECAEATGMRVLSHASAEPTTSLAGKSPQAGKSPHPEASGGAGSGGARSDRTDSRRTHLWRQAGGARAEGAEWEYGAKQLLEARSETELAYALQGRQVYRLILEKE